MPTTTTAPSSHPHPLVAFAEKLPFLHPQPSTPRSSRDWSGENGRRTSIGLPTPTGGSKRQSSYYTGGLTWRGRRRWRRWQLGVFGLGVIGLWWWYLGLGLVGRGWGGGSEKGLIELGRSRVTKGGKEVFWWEEFGRLKGYFGGVRDVVGVEEWVSEQAGRRSRVRGGSEDEGMKDKTSKEEVELVDVTLDTFVPCYIDEENGVLPPKVLAYRGIPQGFPEPLFGSLDEVGLRSDVCYDRINRFGSYGLGFSGDDAGLGIGLGGDVEGRDAVWRVGYRDVQWGQAQDNCMASKKYSGPRTAFVIRTWDGFEYTPHHIMMLRSIVSELALASGGQYTVHFLIHVRNDSIPIWASNEVYKKVLNASLPAEFAGMGTLWSSAQMKLIYPLPLPESKVSFSADDIYKAHMPLHFPLQYFAEQHPEFEFFWEWEMDTRVTGGYLELLEEVTNWAERQDRDGLWERSGKFYISDLYGADYAAYEQSVRNQVIADGKKPISGPQIPASERLSIPGITDLQHNDKHVDLITFSPLFNPQNTQWAFHNDITGYPPKSRPPTRAALITASRLSRRLLLTMHHETFEKKHIMFPEMFPASIALHYGYKAAYAPLPIYFDRDWPAHQADEVFNNAVIGEEARKAGMDHGAGHFHGKGGSVFGPAEHVFRGATWYSNADFAGYLWRRWLGEERGNVEIEWEKQRGRMCLPMMVLHPVKSDV